MADSAGGNSVSAMLYQGVGMLVLCVIFLVFWFAGCRRQRRDFLGNMQTPLLSYVESLTRTCQVCQVVRLVEIC